MIYMEDIICYNFVFKGLTKEVEKLKKKATKIEKDGGFTSNFEITTISNNISEIVIYLFDHKAILELIKEFKNLRAIGFVEDNYGKVYCAYSEKGYTGFNEVDFVDYASPWEEPWQATHLPTEDYFEESFPLKNTDGEEEIIYRFHFKEKWNSDINSSLETITTESGTFSIRDRRLEKYVGTTPNVLIPDEVEIIGECAFKDCDTIVSVEMSDCVKTIEKEAFKWCSNLKKINFSKNLETIGIHAFCDCYSLEEVILPQSIKTIGEMAFEGSGIKSFKCDIPYPMINLKYTPLYYETFEDENGLVILNDRIESYRGNKECLEIPDNVTNLGGCFLFFRPNRPKRLIINTENIILASGEIGQKYELVFTDKVLTSQSKISPVYINQIADISFTGIVGAYLYQSGKAWNEYVFKYVNDNRITANDFVTEIINIVKKYTSNNNSIKQIKKYLDENQNDIESRLLIELHSVLKEKNEKQYLRIFNK